MGGRQRFTLKQRVASFRFAFAGLGHIFRTQHNAWIHASITLAVVLLAFWLQTPLSEWAILVLAMMVVWVAEFVNTAIEAAVDLSTNEDHPAAGIAKDVAAGSVLVAAFGAIIVGLLILGPRLLTRLSS